MQKTSANQQRTVPFYPPPIVKNFLRRNEQANSTPNTVNNTIYSISYCVKYIIFYLLFIINLQPQSFIHVMCYDSA